MARTASSTIWIKASSATISGATEIDLYYGRYTSFAELNPNTKLFINDTQTISDLLNGICIPGNTVPSTETTITVAIGGECNILEYITIEAQPTPTPTPTASPTPTSLPITIAPTSTPTQTPSPLTVYQFYESYVYIRGAIPDQGRFVWYSNNYQSISYAEELISYLCNIPVAAVYSNTNYTVSTSRVNVYSAPNANSYLNYIGLATNSTARYTVDQYEVTVIIENVATPSTPITTTGLYYEFT